MSSVMGGRIKTRLVARLVRFLQFKGVVSVVIDSKQSSCCQDHHNEKDLESLLKHDRYNPSSFIQLTQYFDSGTSFKRSMLISSSHS